MPSVNAVVPTNKDPETSRRSYFWFCPNCGSMIDHDFGSVGKCFSCDANLDWYSLANKLDGKCVYHVISSNYESLTTLGVFNSFRCADKFRNILKRKYADVLDEFCSITVEVHYLDTINRNAYRDFKQSAKWFRDYAKENNEDDSENVE